MRNPLGGREHFLQVYHFLIYIYHLGRAGIANMYRRSQEIEQRLSALVALIRSGKYCTPALAAELGISPPTVSRCLSALRQRGFVIRAVKKEVGWAYEITSEPRSKTAHERTRTA